MSDARDEMDVAKFKTAEGYLAEACRLLTELHYHQWELEPTIELVLMDDGDHGARWCWRAKLKAQRKQYLGKP